VFGHLSPWQLLLVLTTIIAMATEVTSNAATASLLLPILGRLVRNRRYNYMLHMF
jgi:di/tricarboxylate transporter